MSDQLAIFESPAGDRRPASSRMRPGRNRETYARTVAADVTVVDEPASRTFSTLIRCCHESPKS
jgi:hypothetical protein